LTGLASLSSIAQSDRKQEQARHMSLFSHVRFAALAAGLCLIGPTAQAQPPAKPAETGAVFQCADGSKMMLSFAETGNGIAAVVSLQGAVYRLPYIPPEPGPVQVVWSDGEHSLTWSPGVQLMWMGSDIHLMCGRGNHKH
jgi:hypothetical protein